MTRRQELFPTKVFKTQGPPPADSCNAKKDRMRRKKIYTAVFVFGLVVALAWPSKCGAKSKLFRIGTGGRTGVYYPVGKLIARGFTAAQPQAGQGYIGVAQNSAGSVDNVRAVVSGKAEAGLVQADVAAWAHSGEHVFAGVRKAGAVRAVASLYPEKLQIVVRRDAGVRTFKDLRGKRVSIDEIGSGTLAVMRIVLAAHRMTEKDLKPVYLKPVFTNEKMVSGELQGFAMMAGHPMAAVTQLLDTGVTFVPIIPAIADNISRQHPYLVPGTIPAGVYPGVPETPTVQVHALLVVSAALDETAAYQFTAALWSNYTQNLLHEGHSQGSAITSATALQGISIPLHPGAGRYYREKGITQQAGGQ